MRSRTTRTFASTHTLLRLSASCDMQSRCQCIDMHQEFFANYPGFEGFGTSVDQTIFQDALRIQLSRVIALTIEPMAKEAPRTLKMTFGDSPDWKEVVFVPTILMVVSRLISLVFLGEQFMENKEWQRISMMYVTVFLSQGMSR